MSVSDDTDVWAPPGETVVPVLDEGGSELIYTLSASGWVRLLSERASAAMSRAHVLAIGLCLGFAMLAGAWCGSRLAARAQAEGWLELAYILGGLVAVVAAVLVAQVVQRAYLLAIVRPLADVRTTLWIERGLLTLDSALGRTIWTLDDVRRVDRGAEGAVLVFRSALLALPERTERGSLDRFLAGLAASSDPSPRSPELPAEARTVFRGRGRGVRLGRSYLRLLRQPLYLTSVVVECVVFLAALSTLPWPHWRQLALPLLALGFVFGLFLLAPGLWSLMTSLDGHVREDGTRAFGIDEDGLHGVDGIARWMVPWALVTDVQRVGHMLCLRSVSRPLTLSADDVTEGDPEQLFAAIEARAGREPTAEEPDTPPA